MYSSGQQFRIELREDMSLRQSCVDVHCEEYERGYAVVVDRTDAARLADVKKLQADSARRFLLLESETAAEWIATHGAAQGITDTAGKLAGIVARTPPGFYVLVFPPHQPCLRGHRDREVVFKHATPRAVRVHERFEDYREHWDEEAHRVNELMKRG